MKICAITMVYQDHWALKKWYTHYAWHLGAHNLFIIAHGQDATLEALCPHANILTIPRETLAGFDRRRNQMLNSIQDGLGVPFDWVIRTDADELIFLDPQKYESFEALFAQHTDENALFALGLNVNQERCANFSGHYSKAWAVRRGTHFNRHGVIQKAETLTLPVGIYLVHLKFADPHALAAANLVREDVANGAEHGLPGGAWQDAERTARRFYAKFDAMPVTDWKHEAALAHAQIVQSPVREGAVIRAKSIVFDSQVPLPDWIQY